MTVLEWVLVICSPILLALALCALVLAVCILAMGIRIVCGYIGYKRMRRKLRKEYGGESGKDKKS